MFLVLSKVVVFFAVAALAFTTPLPPTQDEIVPARPPLLENKVRYRQVTKDEILRRNEARSIAARGGALQPRQSPQPAQPYPICSNLPGRDALPLSNYANFQGYAIFEGDANPQNPNDNTIVSPTPEGTIR